MNRSVPVEYVLTNEVISEYLDSDPKLSRLHAELHAAEGKLRAAKGKEGLARCRVDRDRCLARVSVRQNAVLRLIRLAIKAGELQAVLLVGTEQQEKRPPKAYWQDRGSELALHLGYTLQKGLEADALLCFRRADWDRCLSPTDAPPLPAHASGTYGGKASQDEHDKWFIQYRDICTVACLSPNSKDDERRGRVDLGDRFDRAKARDSRRRLAPDGWNSTGKRKWKR